MSAEAPHGEDQNAGFVADPYEEQVRQEAIRNATLEAKLDREGRQENEAYEEFLKGPKDKKHRTSKIPKASPTTLPTTPNPGVSSEASVAKVEATVPMSTALVRQETGAQLVPTRQEQLDFIINSPLISSPDEQKALVRLDDATVREQFDLAQKIANGDLIITHPRPDQLGDAVSIQRVERGGDSEPVRVIEGELVDEVPADAKSVNRPRHVYATPDDLRDEMKDKLVEIPPNPEWADAHKFMDAFERKYGVRIVSASILDPQGHRDALKMLEIAFFLDPSFAVDCRGHIFKPDTGNDIRPDGVVLFDVTSTPQHVHDFLVERLGTTKVALVGPEDKPLSKDMVIKSKTIGPEPETPAAEITEGAEEQEEPQALTRRETSDIVPIVEPIDVVDGEIVSENEALTTNDAVELAALEEARQKYVAAKKEMDQFGAYRKIREHLGKDSLDRVAEAFADAEAEYFQARCEYVGTNVERHIDEKLALMQAHLQEYGNLDENWLNKLQKGWNAMGEVSVYNAMENKPTSMLGRYIAKKLNVRDTVRTVVFAGLLAGGFLAAGVATRAVSGFFATRGAAEMRRMAKETKPLSLDEIQQLDGQEGLDTIREQLQRLSVLGHFDGNDWQKIQQRDDFKALIQREIEILQALPAADRTDLLENEARIGEQDRDETLRDHKTRRLRSTAAGAAVGTVMGGWAAHGAEAATIGDGSAVTPSGSGAASFAGDDALERGSSTVGKISEVLRNGQPSGASVETLASGESVLHVGPRGIEGSILDWAKENHPDSNLTDPAEVHRLILKMAKDNKFSIGGSENNLNDIDAANIRIKALPDGKFELSLDKNVDWGEESPDIPDDGDVNPDETTGEDTPRLVKEEVENENAEPDPEIRVKTEDLDPTDNNMDSVAAASQETANTLPLVEEMSYENFLHSVEHLKKSSDALKSLLGKDYNKFIDSKVGLSGRDLNKLQSFRVTEFMSEYTNNQISDAQIKKYTPLARSINSFLDKIPGPERGIYKNESIRNFLIRLAVEGKRQ